MKLAFLCLMGLVGCGSVEDREWTTEHTFGDFEITTFRERDGVFSCADACSLAHVCPDFAAQCGLSCNKPASPENICTDFGLELIATAEYTDESCARTRWIESVCGGLATYCCTVDGSPLGQ